MDDVWQGVPTLADAVADWISSGIVTGKWKPGDRLRELELADELKVSRAPIREALRILDRRGLVEHRARTGAFVSAFSIDLIKDVYAVRAELEGWIAELSVPKLTDEAIATMAALLAEMASGAASDYERYYALGWQFRMLLFSGYQNETAITAVTTLRARLSSLPQVLRRDPKHVQRSLSTNRRLLKLVKNRDAPGTRRELARFLVDVGEHMSQVFLDLHQPTPSPPFLAESKK